MGVTTPEQIQYWIIATGATGICILWSFGVLL